MTTSPSPLVQIPPAVFSAILRSSRDRADKLRRQNSPCNDGRTGYIVDYFGSEDPIDGFPYPPQNDIREDYPEFCKLLGI